MSPHSTHQPRLLFQAIAADLVFLVAVAIVTGSVYKGLDSRDSFFLERDPTISFPVLKQTISTVCVWRRVGGGLGRDGVEEGGLRC